MILVLLIGCKTKPEQESYSFSGFGNLKIGTDINILSTELSLVETNDNAIPDEKCYTAEKYNLTKEVGEVANIFIRTYKNKVYHIAFDSSPNTNRLELSKLIFTDSIQPIGEFKNYEFISKDKKVSLDIKFNKSSNSYVYTDLIKWRILQEKKDSLFVAKLRNSSS